jgi:hypothetical protein
MTRWLLFASFVLPLVFVFACGGGGNDPGSATPTASVGGIATLTGLQAQLASVVLQQSDVPSGLQSSAPTFSTDEDVAGQNTGQLQTLQQQGRQLGVDVQFIPTDQLDPSYPVRGGIQSSASVYTNALGASTSFQATAVQARANNWQANYPDMQGLQVTEVQQKFGDESLWLRVTGSQSCQAAETPLAGVPTPSCSSGQLLVVLDNVIFRVGRVREFLQVSSLVPLASQTSIFEDQVGQWAQTLAGYAATTFPS